jgi:hypothetical protein
MAWQGCAAIDDFLKNKASYDLMNRKQIKKARILKTIEYTQYNKHPARFAQYPTEAARQGAFLRFIYSTIQSKTKNCPGLYQILSINLETDIELDTSAQNTMFPLTLKEWGNL